MYQVHEFNWDDTSVERFWDFHARQNKIAYFAQQVGAEVFQIAKKHVPFRGNILDYGCGQGHLIGTFLDNGVTGVYGADFSSDSVEHVRKEYTGRDGFKEAYVLNRLPAPELRSGFFDVAFLLETIEHLIPPYLDNTLAELSRVIKPGGYLVVTTPSDEDLNMQKVLCPNCGAHFHRVQHVNTFSKSSIVSLFEEYGFRKAYCESINLEGYFTMRKRMARTIKGLMSMPTPGVNLVYIGRKQ